MSKAKFGSVPGACSPTVLIQQANPDYYDFLRFNCLLGRFKTNRGEEITILLPDAKRLAKLKSIKDESELLKEIGCLIIPMKVPDLSSFGAGEIVTQYGIRLDVEKANDKEVVLKNGCKIHKSSFHPRDSKKYFAVYEISGTAPFEGEKLSEDEKKKIKKGGSMMIISTPLKYIQRVQRKVEHLYKHPFSEIDSKNIYFRKVYLQLQILKKNQEALFHNGDVFRHLGNEEVSTSYLLDLITDDHCAEELWYCLGADGPCPEKISHIGFSQFVEAYNDAVKTGGYPPRSITANEQNSQLMKAQSHLDARVACRTLYKDDLNRLGKDLFIIFTNLTKYQWLKDRKDHLDAGGSLHDLNNELYNSYLMYSKWYCLSDLSTRARAAPNLEDDFRDFIGLLKTDVLLFTPTAISETSPFITTDYEKLTAPPGLTSKKLYSMNHLMLLLSSTGGIFLGGGSSRVNETLDKYLPHTRN